MKSDPPTPTRALDTQIIKRRKIKKPEPYTLQIKIFNDEVLKNSNNAKYVKQIADITDEEGL